MINFRYHLVSLVAVFLALAIGIVAGSTVIKESILDQTQQNLDRAEQNLKQLEDSNAQLRAELDQLNSRDSALDKSGATDFLRGRLDHVPVLMVKVDGIDDEAASMLHQTFTAAGADVVGVVTLTDRLALATPADVEALQRILVNSALDPAILLADLANRLGTLITAVADSRPAPLAASTPSTEADESAGVTTTAPSASRAASDVLRAFVEDLQNAGFAKVSDQPDGADGMDLGGLRLAVMSGAGAKLDNAAVVYPFLKRLMGGAAPSTLAVEATSNGTDVPRGSFVGPIRTDGAWRDHISTVDDAEWFVGRAAAVMALRGLIAGTVGHYGVGEGASELLPSTSP